MAPYCTTPVKRKRSSTVARRSSALGLVVLSLSAWAGNAPVESLDTLFYTLAERQAMVRGRAGPVEEEVAVTQLAVSGLVKRERGNSTVWINNRPVPEGMSAAPVRSTEISKAGVSLDGQFVRVGEILNVQTGQRIDVRPAGSMVVRVTR